MDFNYILNGYADVWVLLIVALWTLPWKGVALWRAAHNNSKKWFIAILILNTLALLEILYIFVFSKKKGEKAFGSAQGKQQQVARNNENN